MSTKYEREDDRPLAPGLYLVATPIGNLEDITLRALRVLRSVDRIACEDTRQTQKLLNHFEIHTPTVSYHMHNEGPRAEELTSELKQGARIAVVSDAGTPGIADPGGQIAAAAIAAGIAVFPVPGANAAISGLIASGLPTDRFIFHGFLPAKAGQRKTALEELASGRRHTCLLRSPPPHSRHPRRRRGGLRCRSARRHRARANQAARRVSAWACGGDKVTTRRTGQRSRGDRADARAIAVEASPKRERASPSR